MPLPKHKKHFVTPIPLWMHEALRRTASTRKAKKALDRKIEALFRRQILMQIHQLPAPQRAKLLPLLTVKEAK